MDSNTSSKKIASEEDRLAVTELLNKKQALLVELQHYEANVANVNHDQERTSTTMPTNTRLQLAVAPDSEEVSIIEKILMKKKTLTFINTLFFHS